MLRALPLLVLLAACGHPAPDGNAGNIDGSAGPIGGNVSMPAPSPTPSLQPTNAKFAGRWTGVEGMYLVITPTTPGAYVLEMQYDLDHKGRYEGRAVKNGIAFDRDGKTLTLVPSDGTATGLKYLDGKTDCLTVAPGEGYCRG